MGRVSLAALGWPTYADYLNSPVWSAVREGAMVRAGRRCNRCPKPAQQIHHKTYARVGGGELPADIEALCARCHAAHHGITLPSIIVPLGARAVMCEALTKKKRPCPIHAMARDESGRAFCHVHHSGGKFQMQRAERRKQRAAVKKSDPKGRPPRNPRKPRKPRELRKVQNPCAPRKAVRKVAVAIQGYVPGQRMKPVPKALDYETIRAAIPITRVPPPIPEETQSERWKRERAERIASAIARKNSRLRSNCQS